MPGRNAGILDKCPPRLTRRFLLIVPVAGLFGLLCPPDCAFGWGHEGHAVVALIAEHYTSPTALSRARDLLDGASIDSIARWPDDYRHDHPETGPWHYIDIPLADSGIDMARECPNGDCVVAQTKIEF